MIKGFRTHMRYAFNWVVLALMLGACGGIPVQINGKTVMWGGPSEKKKEPASAKKKEPASAKKKEPASAKKTSAAKVTTKRTGNRLIKDGAGATIVVDKKKLEKKYEVKASVQGTVTRSQDFGFKECSKYGSTLNKPIAVLDIKEEIVLSVLLKEAERKHGFILLTPGDGYVCNTLSNDYLTRRFKPGKHHIYATWTTAKGRGLQVRNGKSGTMHAEVEVRTLVKSGKVARATLDAQTPNPHTFEQITYSGTYGRAKDVGFQNCGRAWVTHEPAVELHVASKRRMQFGLQGAKKSVLVFPNNTYLCDFGAHQVRILEPGTYKLHAYVEEEVAQSIGVQNYTPFFYDVSMAPTVVGEVPTHTLGAMEKPYIFKVKTPDVRAAKGSGYCSSDIRFPTQPDFYLKFERPMERVNFVVLDTSTKREYLYLQDITKRPLRLKMKRRCDDSARRNYRLETSLGKGDGTYAAFFGHAGTSREYTVVAYQKKTQIDAFRLFKKIPKDIPMHKRVVSWYYPLMRKAKSAAPQEYWTHVPQQLMVYAKSDILVKEGGTPYGKSKDLVSKASAITIAAGEPLVLMNINTRRKDGTPFEVTVLTSDMQRVTAEMGQLTDTVPDQLVMPKKPRVNKGLLFYEVEKFADTRAQRATTVFEKTRKKYDQCFDKYWDKHGGSEAKRFVRVTRSKGEVVKMKNMGDIISDRADRKCGYKKLAPLRKKRNKEALRSYNTARVRWLKEIKKKLTES